MNQTVALETERQARELPTVRAVYAAFEADPGPGKMAPHNMRMLLDAVGAAGVQIGAFDVRILEWLAGYEPATCAVVAGLIARAGDGTATFPAADLGTILAALEEAAEARTGRATSWCLPCADAPAELCEEHADDLDAADMYRQLAAKLGGSR